MKHMRKSGRIWAPLLSLFLWLPIGVTKADDINPPPYWGNPNSLVAFWNETTQGEGNWSDGLANLEEFDSSFAVDPVTNYEAGCGPGAPCLSINPLPLASNQYHFFMPNVVDLLPIKFMRVQVTYSGDDPGVDIFAHESKVVDESLPVFDEPENPLADGYFYIDWVLRPNPDWEFVNITVPTGGLLHQVVIDSISTVPIPAALPLFGSALGLMGFIGWKRNKAA